MGRTSAAYLAKDGHTVIEVAEKRRQMGQQGRKYIIENYDSQKITGRIKQVYEKVLSKK